MHPAPGVSESHLTTSPSLRRSASTERADFSVATTANLLLLLLLLPLLLLLLLLIFLLLLFLLLLLPLLLLLLLLLFVPTTGLLHVALWGFLARQRAVPPVPQQ